MRLVKYGLPFRPLCEAEISKKLATVAAKWKTMGAEMGYSGPVVWQRANQFHDNIPTCIFLFSEKKFPREYLERLLDFQTKKIAIKKSTIFWIPRLLPESKNKSADEQIFFLSEIRKKYDLPKHHLVDMGSAEIISDLIISHYIITGEVVPLGREGARTDKRDLFPADDSNPYREIFGNLSERILDVEGKTEYVSRRNPDIGCFPVGV